MKTYVQPVLITSCVRIDHFHSSRASVRVGLRLQHRHLGFGGHSRSRPVDLCLVGRDEYGTQ
ncbi:uncharacterized protein B0H18DRAFT_408951 [Fomitopsis serialis]|uniref:uncharacterized protein n=1 Tax=Fomitopsis serialis TaxID=139415 RepID=UPI0020086AEE|nr:uncharacterized protein B0H18DRAFT_408951 [Neoantrodia serialis]KAH9935293.1 hypothetical protein B0H18DRAFT_408951 [Neoantrodia serialis]